MASVPPEQVDYLALAGLLLADNPVLADKIAVGCSLEPQASGPMLCDVLRFLHLIACYDEPLTPPKRLDLAWHELILFTQVYGTFCQEHFSRMIHHKPGGETTVNRQQFRRTLELYQKHFGPPDPAFWSDADCGSCEAN